MVSKTISTSDNVRVLVKWRVPLRQQDLITLPEHLPSSYIF